MKFTSPILHSWILLVHCLWRNVSGLACSRSIEGLLDLGGQISAPNFPSSYPREGSFYICTYTLRNRNGTNLRLVFNDFHLDDEVAGGFKNGTRDYLQIVDISNSQTPRVYVGINRPNIIYSSGEEVIITLGIQPNQPNTYSGLRTFSAQYSFITEAEKNEFQTFYTDSRTVIPIVSMDQGNVAYTVLAPMGYISGLYAALNIDIIWYIEAESHMKVLFVIKDFSKSNVDDTSSLDIRDGITSEAPALYVARMSPTNYQVMSTQESLYVRWEGTTAIEASFEAYFTFYIEAGGGMQCPGDYYACSNDHCVVQQLTCNMRDNCGDSSDEDTSTVCLAPTLGPLPCEPSPCLHSGTCLEFGTGFICLCSGKFEGDLCEIVQSRTTTSPACSPMCINGGICITTACQCPDEFYGELCQFRNGSNTDFTDLQHTSIMIGAFVGAVCLLSVCWLIAMARKRYHDEPAPGTGHHHRIVSVHTLEEAGLRRNTTVTDNQDIPPEYSIACRRDSRRDSRRGSFAKRYRPSIDSMGPLSPPPAYEIVTGTIDMESYDGIAFRIPEVEERNLPDVVNSDQTASSSSAPPPPAAPASPAPTAPPAAQEQTVYHETEIHDEPQPPTEEPSSSSPTTAVPQDTVV